MVFYPRGDLLGALFGSAGGGLRAALGTALAFVVLAALASPLVSWIAQGTARVGTAALLGLWAPMVDTLALARGIPPVLALGLIAHESGGDYLAVHVDPDGTADAGLGQINQLHWAAFHLSADPFDPRRNVAASLDLLRAAMARHPHDPAAALEMYNGFGTGYARAVSAAAATVARGPALSVWPVSGRRRGGIWLAPASDGRSSAFLLVTAYRAAGSVLALPQALAATRDGTPLALATAATAPKRLRRLTPPQASFWWTAVELPPKGTTARVVITASWPRAPAPQTGGHAPPAVTLRRVVELAPEG